MARLEDFVNLAKHVVKISDDKYMLSCIHPTHYDKTPSLAVKRIYNQDGEEDVIIKCFADCPNLELLSIANGNRIENPTISRKVLEKLANGESLNQEIEEEEFDLTATYDYKDINGVLKFQKCRFVGQKSGKKDFKYRRPATEEQKAKYGIEWIYKLNSEHLLYKLDLISQLKNKPATIIIDESEKNVDFLLNNDIIATAISSTNYWNPEWNSYFVDKDIVVVPHNDDKGKKFAEHIFKSLKDSCKHLYILPLNPESPKGFDIKDLVDYNHGSFDSFFNHLAETEDCKHYSELEFQSFIYKVDINKLTTVEPTKEIIKEVSDAYLRIPLLTDEEFKATLCQSCFGTGFQATMRDSVIKINSNFHEEDEVPELIPCNHQSLLDKSLSKKEEETVMTINDLKMEDMEF